jgi:hypothetical protein
MLRTSKLVLILGAAGILVSLPCVNAQNDPGVAEAIRFQKAEDAAAARQARLDGDRGAQANSADRVAASQQAKPEGLTAAIRFQQAEDAAAARQARIEAGRDGDLNSADRMVTPKAKTKPATSAAARKASH